MVFYFLVLFLFFFFKLKLDHRACYWYLEKYVFCFIIEAWNEIMHCWFCNSESKQLFAFHNCVCTWQSSLNLKHQGYEQRFSVINRVEKGGERQGELRRAHIICMAVVVNWVSIIHIFYVLIFCRFHLFLLIVVNNSLRIMWWSIWKVRNISCPWRQCTIIFNQFKLHPTPFFRHFLDMITLWVADLFIACSVYFLLSFSTLLTSCLYINWFVFLLLKIMITW